MRRTDPRLTAIRRRADERDARINLAAQQLGLRPGHFKEGELGLVLRRAIELEEASTNVPADRRTR